MRPGASSYAPGVFRALTFHDRVAAFRDGADTPRAYLERCLETIAAREDVVRAWVVTNEQGARVAADESTSRWRAGRPRSAIDGMPVGIKDLIETRDMPTQMGSAAYAGNFPKRDSASVRALRDAGAVVLGKTVTTELGMFHPGPTTNPFDPARTPGGSSSGSAAAVGACMVPVALGTQVVGSVIRPAAFCGNTALKPTQGAINRGERQGYSQSTVGIHAGSIEDMWLVAMAIVGRAGGDPGHPGLFGPAHPPMPLRPERLIVMETEGWAILDPGARAAFERVLDRLHARGVAVLRRRDSALIEGFEQAIGDAMALSSEIVAFENRWSVRNLAEDNPGALSARMLARLAAGEAMTLDDYRRRLTERDVARQRLLSLASLADALISPACPGPAPLWNADAPDAADAPFPTGSPVFNTPSSALGAPAVTVPLAAVNGLPFGIQVLGQQHQDARTTAIGRWLLETIEPVVVG